MAAAGGGLSLLRLQVEWAALTGAEAARISGLATGSFSLSLTDPRLNAPRAFPAALKALRLEKLGPALYQLSLCIEEKEA